LYTYKTYTIINNNWWTNNW